MKILGNSVNLTKGGSPLAGAETSGTKGGNPAGAVGSRGPRRVKFFSS